MGLRYGVSLATTSATHLLCDLGQVTCPPRASISSVENNPLLHRVTVEVTEVIRVKCLEPALCNIDECYCCGCHWSLSPLSPQCFFHRETSGRKGSALDSPAPSFSPLYQSWLHLVVAPSPPPPHLTPRSKLDRPHPLSIPNGLRSSLDTYKPFSSLIKCFSSLQSLISNLRHSQISWLPSLRIQCLSSSVRYALPQIPVTLH